MNHVDLTGAVDMHCHFGMDTKRWAVDPISAAKEAAASGFRAIVLKSQTTPTAMLAWAVNEVVDDITVLGGICCDHPMGGINPDAVEVALRSGARIVWLPTLSSQTDVDNGLMFSFGRPENRGLRIIDQDGNLLPQTREVIDMTHKAGAIVATGHISPMEHRVLAEQYKGKILVTHAMERRAGASLTLQQTVQLAQLGCFIEFSYAGCVAPEDATPVADIAAAVRAVGLSRCVLSTDLGLRNGMPKPVDGLHEFAEAMGKEGFSEDEIRTMVVTTPAELLGLQ